MPAQESGSHGRIRSFSRRQGRLTQSQDYALENYWDQYCLDPEQHYDFAEIFDRNAKTILEIGFGDGESLLQMARNNPEQHYIGVEVHRPGVGHLLMLLEQHQLTNVRVFCHDAIDVLERCCSDHCLDAVHLFFPDPWPKRRHIKRRIVNQYFLSLLSKKLTHKGVFHAATDWQPYAKEMLKTLLSAKFLTNTSHAENPYSPRPNYRPLTKFEQRGVRLGHGVWDLVFINHG